MAAAVDAKTCGSCCLKLKELVSTYEQELGLKGKEFDGTKSKCAVRLCLMCRKHFKLFIETKKILISPMVFTIFLLNSTCIWIS